MDDRAHPSGLVELASGIDGLYLSGRGAVSPALLRDLADARQLARESDQPVPLDLGGAIVDVEPRSFGLYPYRLSTANGLIGVTDSGRLPAIRVQPLAEHLHGVGPRASVDWFTDLVGSFTSGLRFTASRVDVFADWQGWGISASDRQNFVGRSTRLNTHEDTGEWTGFEFGRRTTNTIVGRIYDKTRDAETKRAAWWHDVWGAGFDPSRQVVRVEFEFGRKGLTQYGVDTAEDALKLAPSLWVSATTDWLTLRQPTADATRSRWPVAGDWRAIQNPRFAAEAVGLARINEARSAATLRGILPGLIGYLATAAALLGVDTVDELLAELPRLSGDYESMSRRSFTDRVIAKRRKLRLA